MEWLYGQHRPCKIVLLTLVAPRGVNDLCLSLGINIEHGRTTYHETYGTTYHQRYYRKCNSQNTILQMQHSTSAPNERVWRIAQLASFSFNHPSVVLTADVFNTFYKINKLLESVPRGSPSDPKIWWCNNADIRVCHIRCESSSPRRRNEPLGYYFTILLDRMFGLIETYYRGEADFRFCC